MVEFARGQEGAKYVLCDCVDSMIISHAELRILARVPSERSEPSTSLRELR